MANDPKRQKFLRPERERLTRYQHQHRGLSFLELWLPPTTDQEVNVIGINNHVYKGKVPAVPEDELPPGIDEKSIDEEALFRVSQIKEFFPSPTSTQVNRWAEKFVS
ncbi:uncharacterized protein CDAR_240221 [Caerostris darwini]|uniref:Uncharacterized protein n=1 Tax=Caerostris darwini TaxID=1538125 RepID=A0AAV4V433_9ARAC|nr:uncharacterized protein CDAR_240221 [Caerostris darwini]